MAEQLSPRLQKQIVSEIGDWLRQGLITSELAEVLTARYPLDRARPNALGALTVVGAVLIGLGTLLFIAANWQAMAVAMKLILIVSAIVLSHFFGWRLKFEPGNRPKLGSALLLLGSLFYGAGIWLIAQIFNLESSAAQGLLLWSAGTLATAVVTRSLALACLFSVLIGTWSFVDAGLGWFPAAARAQLPQMLLGLLASLTLSGYTRSRSVAWIALAFGSIWMLAVSPLHHYSLLLWGLALFGCYLWTKEHWKLFAAPLLYSSSVSTLGALLIHTFAVGSIPVAKHMPDFALLLFICLTVLALVAWRVPAMMAESAVCIAIALLGWGIGVTDGNAARIMANIVLMAVIGLSIHAGLSRLRSPGLVSVAVVFFVLDVICRYFDFFFSMMDRSLFFITGGVILMLVGATAEAGRRRMMEVMHS